MQEQDPTNDSRGKQESGGRDEGDGGTRSPQKMREFIARAGEVFAEKLNRTSNSPKTELDQESQHGANKGATKSPAEPEKTIDTEGYQPNGSCDFFNPHIQNKSTDYLGQNSGFNLGKANQSINSKDQIKKSLLKFFNIVEDDQLIKIASHKYMAMNFTYSSRFSSSSDGVKIKETLVNAIAKKHDYIESACAESEQLLESAKPFYLNPDQWFGWFSHDEKATMWLWEVLFHQNPTLERVNNNIISATQCTPPASLGFIDFFANEPCSSEGRLEQIYDVLHGLISYALPGLPYKFLLLKELRKQWQLQWKKEIKIRAWEKDSPKSAAFWAFETLLAQDGSEFTDSNSNQAAPNHLNDTRKVRDLNFHINPSNDDEALLAYYALAWQLQARNPTKTKQLLDKCAVVCNQMVRRHNASESKRIAKTKELPSEKPSRRSLTRSYTKPIALVTKSGAHRLGSYSEPHQDELTVYTVQISPSLTFALGRPNAQINQLLIDKKVDGAFFVFADQVQSEGGRKAPAASLESAISIVVDEYEGVLLSASASSLDGAWPEKCGYFILGGGKECAKAVLELLYATECVWCEQDSPPFILANLK